jgi:hypothetical protein
MEAVSTASTVRFSRSTAEVLRTTLHLPKNLDRNIEVFCAIKGVSKNAGMLLLISQSLRKEGLKPEEAPEIHVRYKRSK